MGRILLSLLLGWSLVTVADGARAASGHVERFVHADRLNLRTGPTEAARVQAVLRIGTAVLVVEEREGWALIRTPGDENSPDLEGWVASSFLEPWPPEPIPLREAWQGWNARGEVGNTLALLERIVALDGTDPDEWALLGELAARAKEDHARAVEAFLAGRGRVYVADAEGTLLFSFLPAVPGSVRDEAANAWAEEDTVGPTLADLEATRRNLAGATWWAVDDEGAVRTLEGSPFAQARIVPASPLPDDDRRVIALGKPSASARFWVTAPLATAAARPAADVVTASSSSSKPPAPSSEPGPGARLLLQGVDLEVGPFYDETCATDDSGEVVGPCGGPYGYRVQIRRGAHVEDIRVATGIGGC